MRLSQSGDLKLTFKLTDLHLHAKGHQRQKVRLATQLFSRTVAKAIQITVITMHSYHQTGKR